MLNWKKKIGLKFMEMDHSTQFPPCNDKLHDFISGKGVLFDWWSWMEETCPFASPLNFYMLFMIQKMDHDLCTVCKDWRCFSGIRCQLLLDIVLRGLHLLERDHASRVSSLFDICFIGFFVLILPLRVCLGYKSSQGRYLKIQTYSFLPDISCLSIRI